jgi:uncharacterized protein (DUF2225 family)
MAPEKPIIWNKEVKCPLCHTKFQVENVWLNRVKFDRVYTDMGKEYKGINPLWYEIWVCPFCFYAAYRNESFLKFMPFDVDGFEDLRPTLKKIVGSHSFKEPRDFELAVLSYKLAMISLQCKKRVSAARYGMLFMRLAWLFRAIKKPEEEKKYLKLALTRYVEANDKESNPEIGSIGELGLFYTIGELYRRTGQEKEALNYFMKAFTDKELHGDTSFIKKARDQYENIKEGVDCNFFIS